MHIRDAVNPRPKRKRPVVFENPQSVATIRTMKRSPKKDFYQWAGCDCVLVVSDPEKLYPKHLEKPDCPVHKMP